MAIYHQRSVLRLVLLSIVVALLLLGSGAEAKRKKKKSLFKDRSKKGAEGARNSGSGGGEPEEIKFNSEEEKQEILDRLSKEKDAKKKLGEEPIPDKDMAQYKADEKKLRKQLANAVLNYGNESKEKAEVLHKIGRVLFLQRRFEDCWNISEELLRISEIHDGPESLEIAKALSNHAQTAYRLKRMDECGLSAYRHLYIMRRHYNDESKEVVMARARLMQYGFKDGQQSKGLSHEEYLEIVSNKEDEEESEEEDRVEL